MSETEQNFTPSDVEKIVIAQNISTHHFKDNENSFICLGGLAVKCSVCCTGDVNSIPGPDTLDKLEQELHWSHGSQNRVGPVCPSHTKLKELL